MNDSIKAQLKTVLGVLTSTVVCQVNPTSHPDGPALMALLSDIASVAPHVQVIERGEMAPVPQLHIHTVHGPTGIRFTGIPTGHEFTSLIVALLNSDGKGKLPDDGIQRRIRHLRGPIRLKTFISLTCENCPDVVQALNQMALIHPDFEHEMVDGAYVPDQITALGIQGVPSVMSGTHLVSSGRANLMELIEAISAHVGSDESADNSPQELPEVDVAIIGGGPSGISSAIYTARKGLRTAIVADRIGGQLNDTKGIENFISIPYTEGSDLAANLRRHATENGIDCYENRRVVGIDTGMIKTLHLSSGESLRARSIIVATGAQWRKLGVPGEAEYIGRGVAYCPHCDGPFYKGKSVAVVGGGNSGIEAAIDLAGIAQSVVVVEFAPQLKADQILVDKAIGLPNVSIVTHAAPVEVVGNGQKVVGLSVENRSTGERQILDVEGVFVQIGLVPNSQFVCGVVDCNASGEIIVDSKCKTSSDGIYAAGDVTTVPFKQIVIAVGEGAKAGLSLFEESIVKNTK
ncbi:alkyl hydroperoxide reductase subunit F [bacterium]|nr:alkyl hydroperoxide reductase subunit F [bacterium]